MNLRNSFAEILVIAGLTFGVTPAFSFQHTLAISGLQFPKDEVVKTGDVVTWKNDDLVPHTVTAEDGSFHSPTIESGKEWTYKVKIKKTTAYKCDIHPTMHAKLVINLKN